MSDQSEPLEDYDEFKIKEAIKDLYYWQRGGDSFKCMLYTLFKKADADNKRRLSIVFPFEAEALRLWEQAGDYGNDLFRQFGILND